MGIGWKRRRFSLPWVSRMSLPQGDEKPQSSNRFLSNRGPFLCHPERTRISYFTALTSATFVVLPKENHMQLTEATTLDRKSGEAEGSAVPRALRGNVFLQSVIGSAVFLGFSVPTARWGTPIPRRLYLKVAGIGMFLLWLRVAEVLYAVASVSALPAVLYNRPGWKKICVPAAVSAFFFHFVSLIEMLSASHHSLPVGMHEVQSLLALLICAAFLLVALLYRTVSFGVFALPLSLLLVLGPAIGPDHWTFHSPEIRSGWLSLHIIALLAAYAALIFSLIANFLYLVQERRLKNKSNVDFLSWLPPLETMERIASGMLLIGFPFMTLGLLAGSLIAQESVGPAYFKDPKVLLSFAMWALYLVMLFVRRQAGLRGRRAVYLSSLTFLVVISVWAANQLSSVHRFTAP
jgi:ABC-type uncharacterized transport system permease subunit